MRSETAGLAANRLLNKAVSLPSDAKRKGNNSADNETLNESDHRIPNTLLRIK